MLEKKISRREMLKISGLSILGSSLFSGIDAARLPVSNEIFDRKEKLPFRVSLNTSTISGYKLPIEQQIELCKEAGYDGIELWFRDVDDYVQRGGTTERLAAIIRDSGLYLENMIGFAPWLGDDNGMAQMKKEMELAAALGSKCIAATALGLDVNKAIDRSQFEVYSAKYRELLVFGEKIGVTPLLELWGGGVLNQLTDAIHIAVGAKHEKAAPLLDFYHLYRGGNAFESLSLVNGLSLPLFHINDYPIEPVREQLRDEDRVFPGEGICPFDKIIPMLYRSGFRGGLSLELFNQRYWSDMKVKDLLKRGYGSIVTTIHNSLK